MGVIESPCSFHALTGRATHPKKTEGRGQLATPFA